MRRISCRKQEKQEHSDRKKSKIGKIGRWFEILDQIGIMNLLKLIGVVKTKDKRQVSVGGAVLYLYLLGDF